MNYALITHWSEHDDAVQAVLERAERTLQIFDEDLVRLKLERPERIGIVQRFLAADRSNRLYIVVRNAEPLRNDSPRLWRLLTTWPQNMLVRQCATNLSGLNDSLLIADSTHALVRFHEDQARAKVMLDAPLDCAPYVRRFAEIVGEGGDEISATTLGL